MSKSPQPSPAEHPSHKCCGIIDESVREARKNRRKPQPVVIRKIWILFTFGIMGYSGYAYIARLCLPMLERKQSALGSQPTGILLLIFFSILYLWMFWAYVKVILTAPGYARDHVAKTERPPLSDLSASQYYSYPYQASPPHSETAKSDSIGGRKPSLSEKTSQTHGSADSTAGPSYVHILRKDSTSSHPVQTNELIPGLLDASVQPPLSAENETHVSTPVSQKDQQSITPTANSRPDARRGRRLSKQAARNSRLDELNVFRKPSSTPILQPIFRYCDADELVKPYRAHHCGACGTCVLRYDHHCPWIGQCVGARNHKFFLNFCFATSVFTAYVFASVLFFFIRNTRISNGDVLDPHFIVLLVLSAVFWLFTTGLCVSHVRLITRGQTTVESMHLQGVKERDEQALARGFAWWECSAKRKRRKTFDEEWGTVNTEGNIWWRGSANEEWLDVMGRSWIGWIFPIGSGLSDGLSYPINPRFDSDGRLRKRSEWPEDLR